MSHPAIETRIARCIAKYSPAIQAELRAARKALRASFPTGHELVYDNYNALVFAFSATGRTPDAFLSIAAYPKWITLFFARGVDLDDPDGLLQGTGKRVRGIRLESSKQLSARAVRKLIAQAIAPHRTALERAGPLESTIKSVAATRRARRPTARTGTAR